eukprot:XP_016659261.1 PREDICTED: FLYWCH-type zinc finger-containing protein 1-like isoform X2 [Acyrthosiphon pisum]
MPLEFVISQKGKKLLLLNGYLHNIHQKYDEKIVWRCTQYKKFSCKGRCHTTTDSESGELIKVTDHCHSPNIAQVEAKKVVNSMKETAANEQKNTRNIISENLEDVSIPVIGQLPTTKALSRIIQRTRVIKENPPINPSHVNSLIIPDLYKFTKKK